MGFLPGDSPGTVTVSGKSGTRTQQVGTGAFTAKISLDPGVNILSLNLNSVTVFFAPAGSWAPPAYVAADMHAVDNGCEECHVFSGGAVKLIEQPPELCALCHDDMLKGADGNPWPVPHPPAQEGDCLTCHVFHRLSIAREPAPLKRERCFGCHDDFTDGGKMKMHDPVARGECTGCHGPHGSATKMLLLASPTRELCLKCHKDPELDPDGAPWVVPHPALEEGCPSCHMPHIASSPKLLTKPQDQICADCHEDMNLNGDGERWASPHVPVVEAQCGSCHNPHGSQDKGILNNSPFEICVTCHVDPHDKHRRVDLDPVTRQPESGMASLPEGFPLRRSDGMLSCVGCHRPHGSDTQHMWNRDVETFCISCHKNL